jgi:hypothetical protein
LRWSGEQAELLAAEHDAAATAPFGRAMAVGRDTTLADITPLHELARITENLARHDSVRG